MEADVPTLERLEARLGDLAGKRVLVRSDLNVPLAAGEGGVTVADELRIVASLPTLRWLLERGATVSVCSHLGRPEPKARGAHDRRYSLAPVAARLREHLGQRDESASPSVAVLENLRFDSGETANDPRFVERLLGDELDHVDGEPSGEPFDAYVNDAFGASHRAHASIVGPPAHVPAAAGRLLALEVETLLKLRDNPKRPFVAVLGGAKVRDKLGVVAALAALADQVLIGGAMCFTFLAARGVPVGNSLVEPSQIESCRELLASRPNIELPTDFAVLDAHGSFRQGVSRLGDGVSARDIGPASAIAFDEAIANARTVFWNGPMGAFEDARFTAGTKALAQSIADSRCFSVVGGGDSAAAVRQFKLDALLSFVSTGGGASLELLEHGDLVGIAALRATINSTSEPRGAQQ